MNPMEFKRVITNALRFTEDKTAIVTIGIKPNRPEIGYGYVETSEKVIDDILQVEAFKEKPNKETAEAYLADGNYLWNAGIFVWNVRTIMEAMRRYKPGIAFGPCPVLNRTSHLSWRPHSQILTVSSLSTIL